MPFIQHAGRTFLYLHVPKTGGTTIETWLKTLAPLRFHSVGVPHVMRCTPQHLRMSDLRSLLGSDFFDDALMTVRNPYDRIESEYRMRAILSGKSFWQAWPTFSLWLEGALMEAMKNPFHLDNHLRPQWEFHGTGVEIVKFESGLPTIAARIAEILGVEVPTDLPRLHDTSYVNITVEWDLSDRLLVQEFYRKDFEIFDYSIEH